MGWGRRREGGEGGQVLNCSVSLTYQWLVMDLRWWGLDMEENAATFTPLKLLLHAHTSPSHTHTHVYLDGITYQPLSE